MLGKFISTIFVLALFSCVAAAQTVVTGTISVVPGGSGTTPTASVNAGNLPAGLIGFHGGGVATPFDLATFPGAGSNWAGNSIISTGDGALAHVGTTATWPYIEFAKSGGTLVSPTGIGPSWIIGEIAGIGGTYTGGYGASVLIDLVTPSWSGSNGQINFLFPPNSGAFNQAAPNDYFNAQSTILTAPQTKIGTNQVSPSIGATLQISNAGQSTSYSAVRQGSNYTYYSVDPGVGYNGSTPLWGWGLYNGQNDFELWEYDGSANHVALHIAPATLALQLSGYTNAGLLQNDASGNVTTNSSGVSCPAGTVNLSTFTVTSGIVTHC